MLQLKTKSVEGKRLSGSVGDETQTQPLPMTKSLGVTVEINVKKILAPTDLSSASLAGVRYASSERTMPGVGHSCGVRQYHVR